MRSILKVLVLEEGVRGVCKVHVVSVKCRIPRLIFIQQLLKSSIGPEEGPEEVPEEDNL